MSESISTNKDHLEKNKECTLEHTNKIKQLVISGKTLSADAPVFYPSKQPFNNEQQKKEHNESKLYEDALQELREAIYLLTIDPGDFSQMMPHLTSRFASFVNNGVYPLSMLIEEIFEQSICEDNFRYSGARMCDYLSQYAPLDGFKEHFIARCQKEFERIMSGSTESPRVIAYAFFVGELVVNMKNPNNKGIVPELLQQIGELLKLLLKIRSHQSILCCLKLIKLTGCSLDGSLESFEQVINNVKQLLDDSTLPRNVLALTASVLEQRSSAQRLGSHQNHTESPSSSATGAGDSIIDEDDCGSEGLRRNEEQYFIGDEVMDDETADAFHLFISRQQQ